MTIEAQSPREEETPATRALAVFMHESRTAFAVWQGNAFLCNQGAVSLAVRQQSARRLIETLRRTEHLRSGQ